MNSSAVLGVVGSLRNLLMDVVWLRCLVLHVQGRHTSFRHDVTALSEQAFVNR